MKEKIAIISGIMPVVIILDLITKSWALRALTGGPRIELFGGLIPLTLAFNRGAAFGLSLGNNPRWFFIPITVLALILLIVLLTQAQARDWLRFVSVSLVISGALGNLYDRVRWNRGVVDFIGPIDLGVMHWPIFNVADMAIWDCHRHLWRKRIQIYFDQVAGFSTTENASRVRRSLFVQ